MSMAMTEDQHTPQAGPVWISDIDSKDYLRKRKLAGDWTLTIDARMSSSEVFEKNYPVYDDGSYFHQLSFLRLNDDCAALEWDVRTLQCRIWILIHDINVIEIVTRVRLVCNVLSSYLDFSAIKLSLEEEPNELTLVGPAATRLRELREVVANAERQLNSIRKGTES